jgi:hypothetical protein
MTRADPHTRAPRKAVPFPAFSIAPALLLAGCAATRNAAAVQPHAPGFLPGLWHGRYDFGYFTGIVFLGVGARQARRV